MNALDKVVEMFPNRFGDINLDPYREEGYAPRIKNAIEYIEELKARIRQRGVWGDKTGFACDEHFRFRKSELTIWTGYKGHGKSAVLSQVLLNLMLQGKKVFVCSPEFHPAELLYRFLVQYTASAMPNEEEGTVLANFLKDFVWMYDIQASLKKGDVPAIARFVCEKLKPDHIVIDSLMKCGIPPDDYSAQKQLVDQLQNVAHKNPVHVHLVAHARKGDSDDKPARLHDIKGASEIADLAENVVSVWRNKPKEQKRGKNMEMEPDALFIVEAQRNCGGWIGATQLWYERDTMLYYENGRMPSSYVSMKTPEFSI